MKKQRNNKSLPTWTRYLLWIALFLGFFACKDRTTACNPFDFDTGGWETLRETYISFRIYRSRDSSLYVGLGGRYLAQELKVYDEQHKEPHLYSTNLDGIIGFQVFDDNHRPVWNERSSRTFYVEFPNNDIDTIFFEYNGNRIQPCPDIETTVANIDYLSLSYNRKLYINKAKVISRVKIYKKY